MKGTNVTLLIVPVIAVAASASAVSAREDVRLHYEMPEMSLKSALKIVARRTDHQLVADAKAIRGKRSKPLVGDYSVDEAIAVLVDGLQLSFEIKDRTILIHGERGAKPTIV